MASNMAQVYGQEEKEILILDNGKKEKLMVMEFILGSMEIVIKDSLKTVSSMEKEFSTFLMEILIKAIISVESLQDSESIIGSQVVFSKDSLKLD